MRTKIAAASALLAAAVPLAAFAQTSDSPTFLNSSTSATTTVDDTTTETDFTFLISDTDARQRILNTFTEIQPNILSLGSNIIQYAFDVGAYVTHPCFSIVSDDEADYCKTLFGSHFDLSDVLNNGNLSTILTSSRRIPDVSSVINMINTSIDEVHARTLSGSMVDNDMSSTNTVTDRHDRSTLVWEECKTQTNVTNLLRACFNENSRLIRDTDVSISTETMVQGWMGIGSSLWEDDDEDDDNDIDVESSTRVRSRVNIESESSNTMDDDN